MAARPYVFVNMAVTADGKIDTVARQGARISGPADGIRVDHLRAGADAILVGGHTLLREDPRLTVRDSALMAERTRRGASAQPLKVGVATRIADEGADGGLPSGSRFLNDGGGDVVIFTTTATDPSVVAELRASGAIVSVEANDRVDLEDALTILAEQGVGRCMIEGGSTIVAALFAAGLVDELQLAIAPVLFGGETAPTPVGGPGFEADAAVSLSLADVATSDDGDIVARYEVVPA